MRVCCVRGERRDRESGWTAVIALSSFGVCLGVWFTRLDFVNYEGVECLWSCCRVCACDVFVEALVCLCGVARCLRARNACLCVFLQPYLCV